MTEVRYYGGIDVARNCGWSLLAAPERGRIELVDCGVELLVASAPVCRSVQAVIDRIRMYNLDFARRGLPFAPGPLLVGLEDPYLDENAKTLKVLARFVGRFEQELERARITTMLVTAQAWQTAVLGTFGGVRREARKKACRLWAKATFKRDLPEDAADATGLAYYLATNGRVG